MSYTSQKQFAAACKMDRSNLKKLMHDDEWPVRKHSPWSLKDANKVLAWRETLGTDHGAKAVGPTALDGMDTSRKVDVKLKIERMLKVKLEREILAGFYVPLDEVRRVWLGMTTTIKRMLQGVGASVSVAWPSSEAGVLQAKIDTEIDLRLKRMSLEQAGMDVAA